MTNGFSQMEILAQQGTEQNTLESTLHWQVVRTHRIGGLQFVFPDRGPGIRSYMVIQTALPHFLCTHMQKKQGMSQFIIRQTAIIISE